MKRIKSTLICPIVATVTATAMVAVEIVIVFVLAWFVSIAYCSL